MMNGDIGGGDGGDSGDNGGGGGGAVGKVVLIFSCLKVYQ